MENAAADTGDALPVRLADPPREVREPLWAHAAPPSGLNLKARPVPLLAARLKLPSLKLLDNRMIADD